MAKPSKEQKAAWKASGQRLQNQERVLKADELAAKRKEDLLYVLGGSLLLLFGIGLTLWTYSRADDGGSYAIVYGPVIVGLILLGKGLTGLR